MKELISIGAAIPQLIIAVAAVAIGLAVAAFVLQRKTSSKNSTPPGAKRKDVDAAELVGQVTKLVEVLTDKNGDPVPPNSNCNGERFDDMEKRLASHTKMHRRHFKQIRQLQIGQNEILEHLTGETRPPPPEDEGDCDDTGRHDAQS